MKYAFGFLTDGCFSCSGGFEGLGVALTGRALARYAQAQSLTHAIVGSALYVHCCCFLFVHFRRRNALDIEMH